MAGSYPDPTRLRMAYDRDGTIGVVVNITAGTFDTLTEANLQTMNDEDDDSVSLNPGNSLVKAACLIFPELRDITGYSYTGDNSGTFAATQDLQWSANTTNGVDGSWTSAGTWVKNGSSVNLISLRQSFTTVSLSGVKGLRWRWSSGTGGQTANIKALHVYGQPSATGDRLAFWHPTLDQALDPAHLDWGNMYAGLTVPARQFRIKNLSATLTASDILITREAPTDGGTYTTLQAISLSDDDLSYSGEVLISSIAPGAISDIIYVKYAPLSGSTLSLRWARINAVADSWA